jgi:RNA polymerase sigma factor (sigma-70 family)
MQSLDFGAYEKRLRFMALRFVPTSDSVYEDLLQEGRIALWKASKAWREDGGASLWTFAYQPIRVAMVRSARRRSRQNRFEAFAPDVFDDAVVEPKFDIDNEISLQDSLSLLSEEEQLVINKLLDGHSIRAVANDLGKSKSHIGRIVSGALSAMRSVA